MRKTPRGKRKQKSKQTITRSVTHIRLNEANPGKLEALDALASAFLALCQQYVTHFCIEADPNKYAAPVFETPLSERWHRVAIQQAAGIAQSWHTNYHQQALASHTINTSTTLHKRKGVWWLTLSFDEDVPLHTDPSAPTVGVDVGIANFLTTSTGQQYGSFHGKLRQRQKRDREKRRRKAKLRACLKKKGVKTLPSTSSASSQRLARHVRQSINSAVNQLLAAHPDARIVYEDLSVASMRFKARSMNAYLSASNLAHIPEQLAWATAKRGVEAHTVKAAYSSQQCHRCSYPDRANRPDQQTFCCVVCGHQDHADHNAAANLAQRFEDNELAACKNKAEVKALLLRRHAAWKKHHRLAVVQPPVQLGLFETSTDVG